MGPIPQWSQSLRTLTGAVLESAFPQCIVWGPDRITLHNDAFLPLLGSAHEVLTQSSDNVAAIAAVIEHALAPHQGALGEICARGPPLNLSARQALSLGMCIHELATNAMKYGALSQPGGEVTIRWHIEPRNGEDYFRLTWIESNGPVVTAPVRRGFGSLLIEHVLADDFHGKVDVNYHPQGLRCELTTRLSNLLA